MYQVFRPGRTIVIPGVGVQIHSTRSTTQSAEWWNVPGQTCICAYQPKGAVDLAASYVNLANPGTNNAAPGVAPTFNAADGWTFNGSTQYLTTGILPATSQAWSFIARFSNVPADNAGYVVLGSVHTTTATPYFGLTPRWIDGNSYYLNTGYLGKTPKTGGVMAVAGATAYFNGTAETGVISVSFNNPVQPLVIGGYKTSTTITGFLSGKIQAIAIYSTTLSGANVAALTTTMNAL